MFKWFLPIIEKMRGSDLITDEEIDDALGKYAEKKSQRFFRDAIIAGMKRVIIDQKKEEALEEKNNPQARIPLQEDIQLMSAQSERGSLFQWMPQYPASYQSEGWPFSDIESKEVWS